MRFCNEDAAEHWSRVRVSIHTVVAALGRFLLGRKRGGRCRVAAGLVTVLLCGFIKPSLTSNNLQIMMTSWMVPGEFEEGIPIESPN